MVAVKVHFRFWATAALLASCFPSTADLTDGPPRSDSGEPDAPAEAGRDSGPDSPVKDTGMKDSPAPPVDAPREGDAKPCSPDLMTDSHNCGACGHNCFGTTCTAGLCAPIVLAENEDDPTAMTVDSSNVYWTDSGTMAMGF